MEEITQRGCHVVDETNVIPWRISPWNNHVEQEKVLIEVNYLSLNRTQQQLFRD